LKLLLLIKREKESKEKKPKKKAPCQPGEARVERRH
jgi:hypothetical protein